MRFVPEYRIHQHTRTLKVPTGPKAKAKSRKITRTYGEHVMSYRLFCTLDYKDVVRLLKGGS
jgi:hypothetical protein